MTGAYGSFHLDDWRAKAHFHHRKTKLKRSPYAYSVLCHIPPFIRLYCQRKVEMSAFPPDRIVRFWLIDFRQGWSIFGL